MDRLRLSQISAEITRYINTDKKLLTLRSERDKILKTCDHPLAHIIGYNTDPAEGRSYTEIYCPECKENWEVRSGNNKYMSKGEYSRLDIQQEKSALSIEYEQTPYNAEIHHLLENYPPIYHGNNLFISYSKEMFVRINNRWIMLNQSEERYIELMVDDDILKEIHLYKSLSV